MLSLYRDNKYKKII